jgi:3'-phosphoadenosine 5'-phosphosulfate sulfotransferase (PAPS reductase)/FAD synthetase
MDTQQLTIFGGSDPVTHGTARQQKQQKAEYLLRTSSIPKNAPIVVSYGGGTNSTALLIAMHLKGIVPDKIIFADTGNEHPETYRFIERFDDWLESVGFPRITVVRYEIQTARPRNKSWKTFVVKGGVSWSILPWNVLENTIRQNYLYESLGEESLILQGLPDKAYGRGGCSMKWKVEPINKYLKEAYGDIKVRSFVGIHAGEKQRMLTAKGDIKEREGLEYPLIEWGLNQNHCNALCQWALGETPKKSSCWFCPNARPSEVEALRNEYPELYEIGVFMESQAQNHLRKPIPLGRSFWWKDIGEMTPLERASAEYKAANRKCGCVD